MAWLQFVRSCFVLVLMYFNTYNNATFLKWDNFTMSGPLFPSGLQFKMKEAKFALNVLDLWTNPKVNDYELSWRSRVEERSA